MRGKGGKRGAVMKFVIQGLKYDTDKMKKIANMKKKGFTIVLEAKSTNLPEI